MTVRDEVEALIRRRPGMTEAEIARELFGPMGRQQQVNPSCRELTLDGRVRRSGRGGNGEPFTYSAS